MIDQSKMILPDLFSDFESLLSKKEDIKLLKYLPVKSNEDRASYHLLDKQVLVNEICSLLEKEQIIGGFKQFPGVAIISNKYPYFLPPDVRQDIFWIADNIDISQSQIQYLIHLHAIDIGTTYDNMIIFERDRTSTTPLLKGTLPEIRHIHIWSKKA